MKLAYFGTPQFSADFLEKILTYPELKDIEVVLVVTQPDKPVGRKQTLMASPVKVIAEKHKIPITYLEEMSSQSEILSRGEGRRREGDRGGKRSGGDEVEPERDAEPRRSKKSLRLVDLGLVYAFGKIIPADLLFQPKFGFWNVHPSLLPKHRGASPTAYPLINGDTVTGVTLMQMDEKMDHGPIIAQEKYEIKPDERRPDLERELTQIGFELFKNQISRLATLARDDRVPSKEQEHDIATYTKLFKKDDGFVSVEDLRLALSENGVKVYNKFRGLYPWPGIWTTVKSHSEPSRFQRLKITECALEEGKLVIKKVQFEGKNEIDFNPSIINV